MDKSVSIFDGVRKLPKVGSCVVLTIRKTIEITGHVDELENYLLS